MLIIVGEMFFIIFEILEVFLFLNVDELFEFDEFLLDLEDVFLVVIDCVCCWLDDCFEVF